MLRTTEKNGFSLIEAMVAMMIMALSFVGVYTLASYSSNSMKNSADKQQMQMVANQIFEIIRSDIENIDSYNNMDFTSCIAPTSEETATYYQHRYKWCRMLNAGVGQPATGDIRQINITTSGDSRIVKVMLESRNKNAYIVINNVYE